MFIISMNIVAHFNKPALASIIVDLPTVTIEKWTPVSGFL